MAQARETLKQPGVLLGGGGMYSDNFMLLGHLNHLEIKN